MAFWKIAGLEVTPTIPSSIIRPSSPLFMSSREISSTQGACPSSCIFCKRSFTSTSLWAREPSCGPSRQSTPDPRCGTEKLLRPPVAPSDATGLTTLGGGSNPELTSARATKKEPGLHRDPAPRGRGRYPALHPLQTFALNL